MAGFAPLPLETISDTVTLGISDIRIDYMTGHHVLIKGCRYEATKVEGDFLTFESHDDVYRVPVVNVAMWQVL